MMRITGCLGIVAGAAVCLAGCGGVAKSAGAGDAGSKKDGSQPSTEGVNDAKVKTGPDSGLVLASFAFIVNGVKQTPLTCPSQAWEFPTFSQPQSVTIENTGTVPIAYIVEQMWQMGTHYIPDVAVSGTGELVGSLAPGAQVTITKEFALIGPGAGYCECQGGTIALLGSAAPFSVPGVRTITDEGTIPWPAGVPGGDGATEMQLAEIEVRASCNPVNQVW